MDCLGWILFVILSTQISICFGRFHLVDEYIVDKEDANMGRGMSEKQHNEGYDVADIDDKATYQKLRTDTKSELLIARIDELENSLSQVKQEMGEEVKQLERKLIKMMSNSDVLAPGKKSRSAVSIPVAFSAYRSISTTSYDVKPNDTLVFDTVLTIDGSGYDKSTGVFTAPISGVYVFSYFLVGQYVELHSAVALTVDGKVKSVASSEDANIGGNMVVLSVYKDEKVRVQATYKGLIASDTYWGYTSFSGFLLYVI